MLDAYIYVYETIRMECNCESYMRLIYFTRYNHIQVLLFPCAHFLRHFNEENCMKNSPRLLDSVFFSCGLAFFNCIVSQEGYSTEKKMPSNCRCGFFSLYGDEAPASHTRVVEIVSMRFSYF